MIFMWLMVQLCPFQNNPLWEKLNIAPFVLIINDKPVLHVTSYNMVNLPRFIYFLYFSYLKALLILPQNKHNKSKIEIVVIQ